MKNVKIVLCTLLALAIALSMFACAKQDTPEPGGGSQSPSGSPAASNTPGGDGSGGAENSAASSKPAEVTIGVTGWLGRFLDQSSPPQSYHACDGVYNTLFNVNTTTKEIYSVILEDWYYEDELTFVMKLKPGITFSNGEEATSDDLLFSITNQFDRMTMAIELLGPIDLENCYTDGEYTAVIKYTKPFGPSIADTLLYLYNKSWCEEVGWESQDWYDNPCGSGPYRVSEYVIDDHITLVYRDDYWNAADEQFDIKKWVIKYYPDASTMYMAFEHGDIALSAATANDYTRFLAGDAPSNVGMYRNLMGDVMYFFMGYRANDVFYDKSVREALAYGVDWNVIGQLAGGDLFQRATSTICSDSPYYKNVGAYEYNPERAKQVLADAGYKDGDIKIYIFAMNTDQYKNMTEGVQFYCSQLGIQMDIEFGDMTSTYANWITTDGTDGNFLSFGTGSITREPFVSYQMLQGDFFKFCRVMDDYFQERANEALYTVDTEKRKEIYAELQQYLYDNYLIFPVSDSQSLVAYNTEIFTEQEMTDYVYTNVYMNLHGLGLAR